MEAHFRSSLVASPLTQPAPLLGRPQFIEDVESFMRGKDVDATIKQLQDAYTRCRMHEVRRVRASARVQACGLWA